MNLNPQPATAEFRFYAGPNDFLPAERRWLRATDPRRQLEEVVHAYWRGTHYERLRRIVAATALL